MIELECLARKPFPRLNNQLGREVYMLAFSRSCYCLSVGRPDLWTSLLPFPLSDRPTDRRGNHALNRAEKIPRRKRSLAGSTTAETARAENQRKILVLLFPPFTIWVRKMKSIYHPQPEPFEALVCPFSLAVGRSVRSKKALTTRSSSQFRPSSERSTDRQIDDREKKLVLYRYRNM